jgi:hypothetical protein
MLSKEARAAYDVNINQASASAAGASDNGYGLSTAIKAMMLRDGMHLNSMSGQPC